MSKAVTLLNELLEVCIDGRNGYARSAELVDDPKMKTQFQQLCEQREEHISELRKCVDREGGEPVERGHATAGLHRAWIGLKKLATGDDDKVLDECIRADEAALRMYDEAVRGHLQGESQRVVQRQREHIRHALHALRPLRAAPV